MKEILAGVIAFAPFHMEPMAVIEDRPPAPAIIIQWSPPEQAWRDYYRWQREQEQRQIWEDWQRWRGAPREEPRYQDPRAPGCVYRNIYGRLVPCRD